MSDEPEGVRAWLAWYLTPLMPSSWRIIPSLTMPETLDRPTVVITHTKISKNPAAPLSHSLVNDVVIRVADPLSDVARAEDALDGEVLALVTALRESARIVWNGAEKVKDALTDRLAWDITIQLLATYIPEGE